MKKIERIKKNFTKNILNASKVFFAITVIVLAISINPNIEKSVTIQEVSKKRQTEKTYNIEDVFNKEYWSWHTRTTTNDKAYNGEHIQITNNKITFYGYGQNSYKDFLYKEFSYAGKKIFKITVDEQEASYHTLEGAGFLINSIIKDNKISGYVLLYAEKTIDIYRIDDLDLESFKTKANAKISTYGTLIKSITKNISGIHNVVVETTPTYIKVTDNSQTINVSLDYSKHVGDSFGLIASYLQHDCSILSKIIFEKFELQIENYVIPVKTLNKEEKVLPGAGYVVKDENGQVVRRGSSNSLGIFDMVGLKSGGYTVNQTSAPSGYILNEKVVTFKVTSDGKAVDVDTGKEIEIIFVNEPLQKEEQEDDNSKNENSSENENDSQQNNENNNQEQENSGTDNTDNNTDNNENDDENSDKISNGENQNNQVSDNEQSNNITNNTNAIKDSNLPDRLPQTGENLKIILFVALLGTASIYFAIKMKKYDY